MALSEQALLVLMQHLGRSGLQNIAVWRKKHVINVQTEFLCLYLEFLLFCSFEQLQIGRYSHYIHKVSSHLILP